ncbi:MAG: DUF4430 domain-containing protein [Candidatus Faecivivens sp.]|nr:DUF4430 domain-containing protein [Oscillospiraceae bacterium]MDY2712668.1 DUF4430 domain-containing protein [Candidatus Faecivivens sp.]
MLKRSKLFSTILAFVLSAAVAVSVTSCGSSNSSSSSASSETSVSESAETSSEASSEASSEEASSEESSEVSEEVSAAETAEATDIGEGNTEFAFEVVLEDGTTTLYNVHTDEKTVGAALLGVNLIAGDDSEYGLYVKTVDGVTADYDKDGTYWAFYIDGEYASTGVDSTDVVPGSTYSFKVEK